MRKLLTFDHQGPAGRQARPAIRFSLASLLVVVGLASLPLVWLGKQYRAERDADREFDRLTSKLRQLGGDVHYGPDMEGHMSTFVKLTDCDVTDDDLAPFESFVAIRYVYMDNTLITDKGLAHFAGAKELKILNLSNLAVTKFEGGGRRYDVEGGPERIRITDDGLAILGTLTSLEELELDGTRVTDKGLQHLYGLKKLKTLNLQSTHVTAAGITALLGHLPYCHVSWSNPPPATGQQTDGK